MSPHTPPRHPHRSLSEHLQRWEKEQAEGELAADAARIRGERRKAERLELQMMKFLAGIWGRK